jgi:hypothetical protein
MSEKHNNTNSETEEHVVVKEMSFWDKTRRYIRENWAILTIVLVVIGWLYYNNQNTTQEGTSGQATINMGVAPAQVANVQPLTTTPRGLARYLRR